MGRNTTNCEDPKQEEHPLLDSPKQEPSKWSVHSREVSLYWAETAAEYTHPSSNIVNRASEGDSAEEISEVFMASGDSRGEEDLQQARGEIQNMDRRDLPGLKTSGLPRAIGVRARLPPMKSKSAKHKAASRWLKTLCISLGENSLLFGQDVQLPER